jgi:hypothetical protein
MIDYGDCSGGCKPGKIRWIELVGNEIHKITLSMCLRCHEVSNREVKITKRKVQRPLLDD